MVKIMENPIKMDDLGVPLFLETAICISFESCKVHKFTRLQWSNNTRQASTFLGAETQCTVAAVDEALRNHFPKILRTGTASKTIDLWNGHPTLEQGSTWRHQWSMVFVGAGQWPPVVGWPLVAWLWRWRSFNRGLFFFFIFVLLLHVRGSGGDSFVMFCLDCFEIYNDEQTRCQILSNFCWILQPFQNGEDGQPCALLAAPLRSSTGCRWTLCPAIVLPGSHVSLKGWNLNIMEVSNQSLPVSTYFAEFYITIC